MLRLNPNDNPGIRYLLIDAVPGLGLQPSGGAGGHDQARCVSQIPGFKVRQA